MPFKTYQRAGISLIPDKKSAFDLLNKAGCSKRIIRHCRIVSDHAQSIANKIKENGYSIDIKLVVIGAILHDIGRSRTHDIRHGIEGVYLCEKYGLDERIIRIIKTHIGAGISSDDAIALGLPAGDYIPESLEEKIVAHADNMVEDDIIVSISTKIKILQKKGRDENIIRKIVALNDEITAMMN